MATSINRIPCYKALGSTVSVSDEKKKRGEGLKEIAIKLSCHDFRLEPDKFGLTKPALTSLIKRLPDPIAHTRNIKPMGFKRIIVGVRSKELWRRLVDATLVKQLAGVPYPRLVSVLGFFLGNIIHVAYIVHESLFNLVYREVSAWVEDLERKGVSIEYFFSGYSIPVRNCTGSLGFSDKVINSAREAFNSLLKDTRYSSRMPFLDYIIIATLDLFPRLTLRQLSHLVYAARARLEKGLDKWTLSFLRYRFINRHYNALSEARIIGRMWVPRPVLGECYERLGFIATGDCAEDVYVAAAATLGAANIVVSREYVMATIGILPEYRNEVINRIRDCVLKTLVSYKARVFPLPFELYDPVHRVWRTEPVGYDLYSLLRRFRLMEKREGGKRGK